MPHDSRMQLFVISRIFIIFQYFNRQTARHKVTYVEKFWTRSCELTSVSLINSLMHRQLPDQSSDFPESFSVLGFTQRILLEQLDVSSTFSIPEDGIMSLSLRSSLHMAAIFAIASHIAEVLRPLSRETPSTTSCVLVDQIRKNQETQFKVVSFSRVHDGRQWEGNGQVRPRLEGGRHVTLLDSLGKSNVWDGWVGGIWGYPFSCSWFCVWSSLCSEIFGASIRSEHRWCIFLLSMEKEQILTLQ